MIPKRLTTQDDRDCARRVRDAQWEFMEQIQKFGTVWWCIWNKNSHHEPPYPEDYLICGLIDGMELNSWMHSHPDWWIKGEWDESRYAMPVQLTDAGRAALANRAQYDMEDVEGGLVEPGFIVTPAEAS